MSHNESSSSEQSLDSSSSSSDNDLKEECAVKLKLPENIRAFLSHRELLREDKSVPCESKLAEEVVTNYIIAKNILSGVCWQEKLVFKTVCTTWWSAVKTLARERLNPIDFMYDLKRGKYGAFTKSAEFCNEPLAVLSFIKMSGQTALSCKDFSPLLCKPPCVKTMHSVLDAIHQQVSSPKTCMLSVTACSITYLPLPDAITKPYSPVKWGMPLTFFSGVFIPVIPGVKFHVLNIKQTKKDTVDMNLQKDFFDEIDKICQDEIIKGALVFITDKYLLHSDQDVTMFNYMKQVQPEIPYALGGCLIEDTLYGDKDIDLHINGINCLQQFVSKTLISVVLFTVPKNSDACIEREKYNFDMFSLIVLSSEWTKEKIKNAIDEFAKKVPRFEHSVAFKLSCVGRDKKHAVEQELFREAFPRTLIIGCYGNGELGLNHPPRAPPDPARFKKRKVESNQPELLYSYSTVFVYMGWGKISTPDPDTPKSKDKPLDLKVKI